MTVKDTVLGFGRHTADWFESAPAPENDGEVLVIQVDSKASPTATDKELAKRRGKRVANPYRGSQRHRGRASRKRRGSKKRRKKGDKAKNGDGSLIRDMRSSYLWAMMTVFGPDEPLFVRGRTCNPES